MTDQEIAEKVINRMEGKKKYDVLSRETVFYCRTVWAESEIEAEELCANEGDWGEAVDYDNFEIDEVMEIK